MLDVRASLLPLKTLANTLMAFKCKNCQISPVASCVPPWAFVLPECDRVVCPKAAGEQEWVANVDRQTSSYTIGLWQKSGCGRSVSGRN